MLRFQGMWSWRRKKPFPEEFPEGFKVQPIGISAAIAVSKLPTGDIAKFFREHPEIAGALMGESYDKRFTPSSFIEEKGNGHYLMLFGASASFNVGRAYLS